jgi:ABC-type cobalamin/Fe3+-siderophores transport system ATPase subunit
LAESCHEKLPLLSAVSVQVSLGEHLLLPQTDLAVVPGESVAVLGPSGSGKTTLLAEWLPPSGAWLSLDERDNDVEEDLPDEILRAADRIRQHLEIDAVVAIEEERPRRKSTRKKSTARKTTEAKKTTRKSTAKKTTAKKTTAKKTTAKKPTRKKTTKKKSGEDA